MGGFFIWFERQASIFLELEKKVSAEVGSVVVIVNVTAAEPPLLSKIVNTQVSVPTFPIATV